MSQRRGLARPDADPVDDVGDAVDPRPCLTSLVMTPAPMKLRPRTPSSASRHHAARILLADAVGGELGLHADALAGTRASARRRAVRGRRRRRCASTASRAGVGADGALEHHRQRERAGDAVRQPEAQRHLVGDRVRERGLGVGERQARLQRRERHARAQRRGRPGRSSSSGSVAITSRAAATAKVSEIGLAFTFQIDSSACDSASSAALHA